VLPDRRVGAPTIKRFESEVLAADAVACHADAGGYRRQAPNAVPARPSVSRLRTETIPQAKVRNASRLGRHPNFAVSQSCPSFS